MHPRRSPSFTCVQMSFVPSDIKQIKLPRTLVQVIIHYMYFLFKKYIIQYRLFLLDGITLYDDGMKIEDSFIPYEYLVTVDENSMVILAKYDDDDKLVPSDNLMRLDFKKKIDPKIVQNNLYYHLKYNTVSLDVLSFKSVKAKI